MTAPDSSRTNPEGPDSAPGAHTGAEAAPGEPVAPSVHIPGQPPGGHADTGPVTMSVKPTGRGRRGKKS